MLCLYYIFRLPEKTTVIASRQTGVSGFTAYSCVVARMRSIRGNPCLGVAISLLRSVALCFQAA